MQITLICTVVCSILLLPAIKAQTDYEGSGTTDSTNYSIFPTDDEDDSDEEWSGSGDIPVANLGRKNIKPVEKEEDEEVETMPINVEEEPEANNDEPTVTTEKEEEVKEEPEANNDEPTVTTEKEEEVKVEIEIEEEDVIIVNPDADGVVKEPKQSLLDSPHFMWAVIIGGCIGLICTICVIMLLVYRMRKRDEGSYALDDKNTNFEYTKGISKEYHV